MTAEPSIADLFSACVVSRERRIPSAPVELHPEEAACLEGASPDRLREFAAGRALAREAAAELGVQMEALPSTPSRMPAWPRDLVGSISHTRRAGLDLCAVAVARARDLRSIGLDVESRDGVRPRLRRRILRPDELSGLEPLEAGAADLRAVLAFSAKEAFYKCQFPLTGRTLGFQAASVRLDLEAGRFVLTLQQDVAAGFRKGDAFPGRLAVGRSRVATGLEIAATPAAA
ncbi:MAG: 4'-phosphopantetheinyl transferase family protein [Myxococcota bacterium]